MPSGSQTFSTSHTPLQVGITGGIGSGKTTVCQIFKQLGIPVYYADIQAKILMDTDEKLQFAIIELFGEKAYLPDGTLNRSYIGSIIFNDAVAMAHLNAVVHPAVQADAEAWHARQRGVSYTLREAAILFESGSYRKLDRVITIFAPVAQRMERVMRRDGLTQAAVEARIRSQWPDEKKMALADFTIFNDGTRLLLPQVMDIHRRLLELANEKNNV